MDKLNISVVVPLYNEAESLPELAAWIDRVMRENGFSYELILIDDGSSDGSWEEVERLKTQYPAIRGIGFARNYGKSAALYCGFAAAEGEVVITMDADLQDSPDEIPELRRMILEEGYDLVSGWKKKRHDPIGKRWPSKFFNWTARAASGIRLHDFNCGLKAYRRKVVKAIEVYGEMHRFIPFLAKQAGFGRIGEKVVDHRARKYGSSKFGLERTVKGYLDLITVLFMTHFGRSPMYFFGSLGTLMFLMGGGTTVWIIAEKLWKQSHALPLRAVTDQPLFYLAILAVILGVQLFLAGFLGELINRGSSERNKYLIDKTLYMIQRIQTLYLLIIAALMAVTLFSGLAWFAGDAGEFGLYAFGLKTAEGELVQSTVYMGVLLALACALPLVTIFLFRRRLLQIRLCVVEMVLLLGSLVMEGVYYFLSWRVFSDLTFHTQGFKPAIVLPLVCLLFAYLAARAIFRDELLVRAADRIR